MTIADDISALSKRVTAAETAHARAQGMRDNAQEAYNRAREELYEEFKVGSVAEADELLRQLETEIEDLVEEITARLDEIGA